MRRNNFGSVFIVAALLPLMAAACGNMTEKDGHEPFVIGAVTGIDGLHAPWDGLDDSTSVRFFADSEDLCIVCEVEDTTLAVTEDYRGENDVEPEEMVVVFFSAGPDMELYYCAEIDPLGRVLDYSCRYPSQMDYGWDFSTLRVMSGLTADGYAVSLKVSLSELESFGIDTAAGFYMGIFRADFRPDGSVNWYSHVKSDDASPNFHQPKMLFYTRTE